MFDRLWLCERGTQTLQAILHTNKEDGIEAEHRVAQFTLKTFSIWNRRLRLFPGFVLYGLCSHRSECSLVKFLRNNRVRLDSFSKSPLTKQTRKLNKAD